MQKHKNCNYKQNFAVGLEWIAGAVSNLEGDLDNLDHFG